MIMDSDSETAIGFELPLAVSLCYYAAFTITGQYLRTKSISYLRQPYKNYVNEVITSFQVLGCSLENGQVRHRYGYFGYFVSIYLQSTLYSVTLHDSSANPCTRIVQLVTGSTKWYSALLLVLAQIVGALVSHYCARQFWMLGLTPGHRLKLLQYQSGSCQSDLSVPVITGIVIESASCLCDYLLFHLTWTNAHHAEMNLKCLLMCLLTVAGIPYTGLYMNPLNASNQTLGCRGNTIFEHLLVYWICPLTAVGLAASAVAWFSSQKVHQLSQSKEK